VAAVPGDVSPTPLKKKKIPAKSLCCYLNNTFKFIITWKPMPMHVFFYILEQEMKGASSGLLVLRVYLMKSLITCGSGCFHDLVTEEAGEPFVTLPH
jgi:hypothetical protein